MSKTVRSHSATRRGFLYLGAAAGLGFAGAARAEARAPAASPYLFALGVASGDPTPVGVVLWTRLAPDPLNGGGMPALPVLVQLAGGARSADAAAGAAGHRSGVALGAGPFGACRSERPRAGSLVLLSLHGRTVTTARSGARGRCHAGTAASSNFVSRSSRARTGRTGSTPRTAISPSRSRSRPPPRRLHLRGRRRYRMRPASTGPGDVHPGELPQSPRALQDGPASAGGARRVPVARRARTTTMSRTTMRTAMPEEEAILCVPGAARERLSCVLRAHAAAADSLRAARRPAVSRPDVGDLVQFSALDTRQYRSDQPCGDGLRFPCAGAFDPRADDDRTNPGAVVARAAGCIARAVERHRSADDVRPVRLPGR